MSAASWSPPASRRCAIAERFERANDDYSSILVKALADRFAEAFAERMHERVRKEFWGYAPDESLAPRGADRRALSRHPPGARLSGAARPHREGDAVPPARRRSARIGVTPDRELRHVAGLVGLGPLSRPSRRATISASPRSSATRSRTMPRRKGMPVAEVERWLGADPQLCPRTVRKRRNRPVIGFELCRQPTPIRTPAIFAGPSGISRCGKPWCPWPGSNQHAREGNRF